MTFNFKVYDHVVFFHFQFSNSRNSFVSHETDCTFSPRSQNGDGPVPADDQSTFLLLRAHVGVNNP